MKMAGSLPRMINDRDDVGIDQEFPGRLLHQAALWENEDLLQDLLLNGDHLTLVNSRDVEGRTALHAAAAQENYNCTRILLKAGANPNVSCSLKYDNKTPLHVASEHGRADSVGLLVKWRADLLTKDRNGLTALDIAEKFGHVECMAILKQAADEQENARQETHQALLEACSRGDIGKMRLLLKELDGEAAMVVSSAPNGSNTLLFKACEEGHKEIVKLLLEYGADGTIHPVTKYSPLYIACYNGRKDITELLLKRYPHLVQVSTVERWLPIHAAAINGHVSILDILLRYEYPPQIMQTLRAGNGEYEYRLPFDVNAADVTGQTILYVACYVGNQKIVDLLLKFRVRAVKVNDDQQVEASISVVEPVVTIRDDQVPHVSSSSRIGFDNDTSPKRRLSGGIQMIMSKLNLKSSSSSSSEQPMKSNEILVSPLELDTYCANSTETALHAAVKHRHHAIVTTLLAHGANPNLRIQVNDVDDLLGSNLIMQDDDCTFNGSTALVEACKNRDYGMIELLLKNGARDDECKSLAVAVGAKDEVTVSKLLVALRTHPDPEYKINKKAMDVLPVTQFGALAFAGVGSVTYSSMYPTVAVMINWHGLKCLDHVREQWLVDASVAHNTKLKLNVRNQLIALYAITRLDISNNAIIELPATIFQLASLKHLNVAQNKIETLPAGCGKLTVISSPPHKSSKSTNQPSSSSYDCPVLEEVHLQDNRLDSIPRALFDLPALLTLDLSNNKLRSLPFHMWTSPRLRELNLSFNLLSELPVRSRANVGPEVTKELPDDFDGDRKSPVVTPENRISGGGGTVDISPHGVRYTSAGEGVFVDETYVIKPSSCTVKPSRSCLNLKTKELHHCNAWSRSIEVNDSILDDDERNKDNLSQLSTLNLSHNAFELVPTGLSCLAVNLARLNLSYNRLTAMGHPSSYPIGMKQLDLSHNHISGWPAFCPSDSDLHAQVQESHCHSVPIIDASPKHSTNKTAAAFGQIQVRKLNTVSQSLSSPLVSSMPSVSFRCVHRRHRRLDNLRTLILADNELDKLVIGIGDDAIAASDDDEEQDTMENTNTNKESKKCSSPTPSLKSKLLFPNISMLDISNNRLREVPASISELANLSVLNISGNAEITHLPPEMGLLGKLWNLNTRGCNLNEPLKNMIDSKRYKTMDVVGYLKSILENARRYARMKLMIVGVQGIGKTSLLDQLRQEGTGSYKRKPPEHWAKRMGNKNINLKTAKGVNISTVGVDIGDWTYEKKIRGQSSHGPVAFRTWDFGGQREYYATHQYFLSRRSLYLVVWKITDGERGVAGIQQWLVNIQARAPNSPVLIIGTHYDLVKEKYPPSFSEDFQQLIRDKFINVVDADKCGLPRVLDTIEISCKTRHNVKLLCNLIYDTVFELRSSGSKERLLEQHIPATYLALEDVVGYLAVERRLKNKDPVLQSEQYKMLVMHEMQEQFRMVFRDMAELNQATAFLHENGVLLHYEDATLKELYFLDPQWLCDMLAHVVTIREINPFARNGVMKMEDLKHTFKSSQFAPTDSRQHYLVNLLNKFEVALTWDNRTLLIPSLLPTEEHMKSGLPGCDVRIPVRSRGWTMRSKAFTAKKGNQGNKSEDSQSSDNQHSDQAVSQEECHIQHHFDPHASIRRLLLMSYFPSGFWSRLLTRMLADDNIVEIVRSYFVLPNEVRKDPSLLSMLEKKAEWVCWQTGIELRYANTALFRMKDILQDVSNAPCDYRRMRFMLQQEGVWGELDLSSTAILEVLLTNQTIVLKRPFPTPENVDADPCRCDDEDFVYQSLVLEPNPECVAKLLSLAVDHIDTLLEDWYPTLGTRFVHTSEGKFLVTRVVPCTPCLVNQFRLSESGGGNSGHPGGGDAEAWNMVDFGGLRGEACVSQALYLPGIVGRSGISTGILRMGNMSPRGIGRRKNQGSRDSCMSHDSDSGVGPDSTSSSRKPSAEGRQDLDPDDKSADDDDELDPAAAHMKLVYSFTIEECILTAYEDKCVRCPAHGGIPLAQIAPDTVFMDLGERYLIRPEAIKRGKMLGRGAFGFVFRATVKQRASNLNMDVAMKMLQPVEPGYGARPSATAAFKAAQSKWQRDPIQYACKAYCTARQELGILLSLRHSNIVPLVGMCTHPLSLVLELAPQGALDAVLKNYRRSGTKLSVFVLQKIIIQVAKALEYLHSQHIIYRDLKSENVLVWQLPQPFHTNPLEPVDVKLADYGISRSTLPTGAKGFGGTEGFMAPEIMRYNGEEEYTEKVDCFSFGMFMYELLTLHLPFEGHESVKDHILEGGRPSLSRREIIYPTYVLDLMTLCWSQHPKDRPSASQIVSIAAAPEFVHLVDAILLDDALPVICGAIVHLDDQHRNNEEEHDRLGFTTTSPVAEIWLSRKGRQVDVVSCHSHGWQNYKTLELDMVTISRICVVGETIWLGDAKGVIHIYSASRYAELLSFQLEPDVHNPSAVNSIQYNPVSNLLTVSLVNGRIWLCKVDWLFNDEQPLTTSTVGSNVEHSLIELGSNGLPIHCTAVLFDEASPVSEVWCGQSKGQITVFTLQGAIVTSQNVLTHGEAMVDALDVLQIATDQTNNSSVWSYVYPGCIVYHWDRESRSILHKLDCSKLAPCSESLKSISIEEHLSPGRCQVTSVAVLNDELYIGTTWGCVVVSEARTMRPITIFRPFEEDVKVILAVTQSKPAAAMTTTTTMSPKTTSPQSPVRTPSSETSSSSMRERGAPPIIATIGKGYRNLIGRFTNPSVGQLSTAQDKTGNVRRNIVALLWRSEHWAST